MKSDLPMLVIAFVSIFTFGWILGAFYGEPRNATPNPTNSTGTLIIETGQTMKIQGKQVPIYKILHEVQTQQGATLK